MSAFISNQRTQFAKLKEAFNLPDECISATISLGFDRLTTVTAVYRSKDSNSEVLKEFYLCEKK